MSWTPTPIGEVGEIFDGPHATPTRLEQGSKYFLNISSLGGGNLDLDRSDFVSDDDFDRWTRRVTPRAGDLLFSYETRLGEAALMPPGIEACLGRRMALIRPDSTKVVPRFLLYTWRSAAFREQIAEKSIRGATVDRIPLKELGGWTVDLPNLHTQRAIADVLGALDDKIAANRALISASDELIRAQVRRSPKKEAPLFGSSVTFTFGEPFQGADFCTPGEGRPLIRIRDLKSHACQVWTREVRSRETSVRPGEVLVGMDAEFVPARWAGPVGLLNQRVLRASSDTLGSAVTWATLSPALDRIARSKSGTTVIHLNKTDLQREVLHVPTDATLPSLRPWLDSLWNRATAAEQEIIRLARTRDELLPALMSGRITVKDAEGRVEKEV